MIRLPELFSSPSTFLFFFDLLLTRCIIFSSGLMSFKKELVRSDRPTSPGSPLIFIPTSPISEGTCFSLFCPLCLSEGPFPPPARLRVDSLRKRLTSSIPHLFPLGALPLLRPPIKAQITNELCFFLFKSSESASTSSCPVVVSRVLVVCALVCSIPETPFSSLPPQKVVDKRTYPLFWRSPCF